VPYRSCLVQSICISLVFRFLITLAEYADVTESILKSTNILSALKEPRNLTYFRSLSVTDQPRERPDTPLLPEEKEKHVILSLAAPPASRVKDTVALVEAMFPFIDSLSKLNLRPETKNKLKKTREEVDKQVKEDAGREKKEEVCYLDGSTAMSNLYFEALASQGGSACGEKKGARREDCSPECC
jgi:hypothetical protein